VKGDVVALLPVMSRPRIPSGILFYDADCAFCRGWVRFVLRHDKPGRWRFAPLHGATARAQLKAPSDFQTVVLLEASDAHSPRYFVRSEAVLRVLEQLGGVWRLISWVRVLPVGWRDAGYAAIAARRQRWLRRGAEPPLPPAEAGRFLP